MKHCCTLRGGNLSSAGATLRPFSCSHVSHVISFTRTRKLFTSTFIIRTSTAFLHPPLDDIFIAQHRSRRYSNSATFFVWSPWPSLQDGNRETESELYHWWILSPFIARDRMGGTEKNARDGANGWSDIERKRATGFCCNWKKKHSNLVVLKNHSPSLPCIRYSSCFYAACDWQEHKLALGRTFFPPCN